LRGMGRVGRVPSARSRRFSGCGADRSRAPFREVGPGSRGPGRVGRVPSTRPQRFSGCSAERFHALCLSVCAWVAWPGSRGPGAERSVPVLLRGRCGPLSRALPRGWAWVAWSGSRGPGAERTAPALLRVQRGTLPRAVSLCVRLGRVVRVAVVQMASSVMRCWRPFDYFRASRRGGAPGWPGVRDLGPRLQNHVRFLVATFWNIRRSI
jgi:hypothetical protein